MQPLTEVHQTNHLEPLQESTDRRRNLPWCIDEPLSRQAFFRNSTEEKMPDVEEASERVGPNLKALGDGEVPRLRPSTRAPWWGDPHHLGHEE